MGPPLQPSAADAATTAPAESAGQLLRGALVCGVALIAGLGIGLYLARQQLRLEEALAGQLQHEIRELTGDIQRLEQAAVQTSAAVGESIRRTEVARREDQVTQRASLVLQMDGIDRKLAEQASSLPADGADCLAEFDEQKRRGFAVSIEEVTAAVERLVARQRQRLTSLSDDFRNVLQGERTRLAASARSLRIASTGEEVRSTTPGLSSPLPAFAEQVAAPPAASETDAAPLFAQPAQEFPAAPAAVSNEARWAPQTPRAEHSSELETNVFAAPAVRASDPQTTLAAPPAFPEPIESTASAAVGQHIVQERSAATTITIVRPRKANSGVLTFSPRREKASASPPALVAPPAAPDLPGETAHSDDTAHWTPRGAAPISK